MIFTQIFSSSKRRLRAGDVLKGSFFIYLCLLLDLISCVLIEMGGLSPFALSNSRCRRRMVTYWAFIASHP